MNTNGKSSDFPEESILSADASCYKCSLCDGLFTQFSQLRQHLLVVHGITSNSDSYYSSTIKDNVRNITYTKKKTNSKNMKPTRLGKNQMYECSVCKTTFRSFEGISIHLKTSHSWLKDMWEKYFKVVKKSSAFEPPLKKSKFIESPSYSTTFNVSQENGLVHTSELEVHKCPSSFTATVLQNEKSFPYEKINNCPSVGSSKMFTSKPNVGKSKQSKDKSVPSFSKGLSNLFARGLIPSKKLNMKANDVATPAFNTEIVLTSEISMSFTAPASSHTVGSSSSTVPALLSPELGRSSAVSISSHPVPASSSASVASLNNSKRRKRGKGNKRCCEEDCQPCGVAENCMVCKFCCNKALK